MGASFLSCASACTCLAHHAALWPHPLCLAATYPTWQPDAEGQQLLQQVAAAPAASLVPGGGQHPLAWSLLPHGAPQAPPGLVQRRHAGLASSGLQSRKMLAAALAAGRRGGPDSSGIFGSADLTAAAREEAALAAVATADPHLDAVGASQLLLQSLYEQRRYGGTEDDAAGGEAPQPLQPQSPPQPQQGGSQPLAPTGFWSGQAATAAAPVPSSQQLPALRSLAQAPVPIPPAAGSAGGRSAGTSPLHALLASPSPQQRVLQQAAGARTALASPRQTWLGRSPSGRARVAELSVLSRENSSAGTAAQQQPAQQQAAPPAVEGSKRAAPDPLLLLPHELPPSGSTSAPSDDLSESLLLQQLQGSQPGSGLHQSGGSLGSDDAQPPEFF